MENFIITKSPNKLKVKSSTPEGGQAKLKVTKGDGKTVTEAEVDPGINIKLIHRTTRSGFKGAALREALKHTDKRAEFIVVFDADFFVR